MPLEHTMSLAAVFLASLLGSTHCVAMCGGFVAAYAGHSRGNIAPHIAYHGGRFITYVSLGMVAGFIGRGLDNVTVLVGIQRGAGLITGLLLILWGVGSLTRMKWQYKIRELISQKFSFPFHRLAKDFGQESVTQGALILGLCSTLLPCAWLYGYAAIAAATGSPLSGAIVMMVFWLGTLPLLGVFAATSGRLVRLVGARAPLLASALLILAGVFSLLGHFDLLGNHHCH